MRVFHLAVTKFNQKNEINPSKRSTHSHRGAAHRTQHGTSLPKHYKNVDGLLAAHGAARNRVAKCTWGTTKRPSNCGAELTPCLCDCKGPKNANDCAGARLGMFFEDSNAGFMSSRCFLGLRDEKHSGKKGDVVDASHLNQQGLHGQKTRVRRSAR